MPLPECQTEMAARFADGEINLGKLAVDLPEPALNKSFRVLRRK